MVQCPSNFQHLSELENVLALVGFTPATGGRNEAVNTQWLFKGSMFTCHTVRLHLESLHVARMRGWKERILSLLPLGVPAFPYLTAGSALSGL